MARRPRALGFLGPIAALVAALASCSVPASAPCADSRECPAGFRCVQSIGVCRAVEANLEAGTSDAVVDAAADLDARPADRVDASPVADGSGTDATALDGSHADASDAAPPLDAQADVAAPDVTAPDAVAPDLVGFDAAGLVCSSSFGFTPEPPVPGQTLQVHYYSSFRYASLDLLLTGAGNPVVTGEDMYDFGSSFTFIFDLSAVQAGLLDMILVSGAMPVDTCSLWIEGN